ncbi:hypothetical protein [Acinetobacter pragensis]|uniref:hypothetical protein n=1 Tax=Acinetobacter pragensis TaxID=1806892 RepID=UPI0039F0BAC1
MLFKKIAIAAAVATTLAFVGCAKKTEEAPAAAASEVAAASEAVDAAASEATVAASEATVAASEATVAASEAKAQ